MKTLIRNSALALAAAGMAASAPAAAHDRGHHYGHQNRYEQVNRDRYGYDTRYYGSRYHSEPVTRSMRTWRGDDGRYYCRHNDGTTGLIIGAAAGALLGRAVDGGYNHTTGTILGGVVGALLGKKVAQGGTCR